MAAKKTTKKKNSPNAKNIELAQYARDDEFEDELHVENEADLSASAEAFKYLVLAPTDWTISSIVSQIGGQIDLNPEFQRRDV
jgi:hypothetical protein